MKRMILAGVAWCMVSVASAQVQVQNAWARATVPGQTATGVFMTLTSKDSVRLTGVQSSVAGVAELHEMKMSGDVMSMRAIPMLELPAGKPVRLMPGGHHLMLMDLKAPLNKDSTIAVTLTFKDAKGIEFQMPLTVPVSFMQERPGAAAHPMGEHGKRH